MEDRLEDSLARLDEALGSPAGGIMRVTPAKRTPQRRFQKKVLIGVDESLDASLRGLTKTPKTSLSYSTAQALAPVLGLSMADTTVPEVDVTMPTIGLTFIDEQTLDATSTAFLVQEDPGVKTTQILFPEFMNIMCAHPSEAQTFDEIEKYECLCSSQMEILYKMMRKAPKEHNKFSKTSQVYQQLLGERNTWRLVGSLYAERLCDESEDETMLDTLTRLSDKTIVNQLYEANKEVKEAQLVIDWLERNSADDSDSIMCTRSEYFGNTHISWENSLKVLKNQEQGVPLFGHKPLVKSLDPDAVIREGNPLHDLDMGDEARLVQQIFTHMRAGQLSLAQELCQRSGHFWRAAVLEGWKLHHDPNYTAEGQRLPVEGNLYRDVWKSVAWKAASDERLPSYERAVFGTLCGHLDSVLGVCKSWNDAVWAYTRVMVDHRVEEQIRRASSSLKPIHPLPQMYPEERLTMADIFEKVESMQNDMVQCQKQNPYHLLQKFIILDDIEGLLQVAHSWICGDDEEGRGDGVVEGEEGYCRIAPHLLRCLTHLILILKRIGKVSYEMESLCTDILEAYVKEMIERGDTELVARYTSALPQSAQVKWYARFLENITEDEQRRLALTLAEEVGLDVDSITQTVVLNIRHMSSRRDPEGELVSETTSEDRVKISALDWLLYDPRQRLEALQQGNALMRSFLISRKIGAARMLFNKIPKDSVNVVMKEHECMTGSSELPHSKDNIIREYFCMRAYLFAQDSFTDWFDHFHQKKPHMPKRVLKTNSFSEQIALEHAEQQYASDIERWKNSLELLVKTACDRLYNVLLFPEGGWLVDTTAVEKDDVAEAESADTDRAHQMSVLRSIYIPQVASLLQNVLHSSEHFKECIQLSDTLASEQHQLYKCFSTNELQRFLCKLQETSQVLLDNNMDALGYPLH